MSDTARPKSSGDKLDADEINHDLPTVETAGEAIDVSSSPLPCFIKDSDGKWYKSDADDTDKIYFHGFAVSSAAAADDDVTIQNHGVVSGFTGLDAGKEYYVQDDGSLGTSPGTNSVLVGTAISATEILILKDANNIQSYLTASDNLKISADTERTSTFGSYEKKKEIVIGNGGAVRVKFDLKSSDGGYTQYAKVYINGSAVGTERNTSSTSYETYSEDFYVSAGDLIQLYIKNSGVTAYVCNFRIYYDKTNINNYAIVTD